MAKRKQIKIVKKKAEPKLSKKELQVKRKKMLKQDVGSWGEESTRKEVGAKSPVRPYKHITVDSNDPGYTNRVLVCTPTLGRITMKWALARFGQVIPMNWSQVSYVQFFQSFVPLRYTVANAQNICVKEAIERDFEWMLFIEDDVILPPDAFVKFNRYMRSERYPIVSGLYFSKSKPSDPLVFRGKGTSSYTDFKIGEKVWVDGVPTGCLLIHMGLMREIWNDSPEYTVNGIKTRRVFREPRDLFFDPETGQINSTSGTSDLDWCWRVKEDGYLEKSGWDSVAKKKYPFLVDTSIFCRHIDINTMDEYPLELPPSA